jgi:periplasmic protein TonB
MNKSPKRLLAASFILAMMMSFCLFALIPQLAREEVPRQLPVSRAPVRLYTAPPPEPETPQRQPEEKTEQTPPVERPLQAMTPLKPRLLQAPELDYAPPQVALDLATTGPPVPLTELSGVYRPDELDRAPALNFHVKPLYPYRAKRMGISGYVVVEFDVNVEGNVEQIRIIGSEPPGVFDAAVLESVRKWRFHPGELLGDRVATHMVKKIVFNLEE